MDEKRQTERVNIELMYFQGFEKRVIISNERESVKDGANDFLFLKTQRSPLYDGKRVPYQEIVHDVAMIEGVVGF